jgi:hypothetical protein
MFCHPYSNGEQNTRSRTVGQFCWKLSAEMTRQNGKQTSTTTIIIIGNKKRHNQLLVFVFVLLSGLSKPHHPFFSNNATLSGAFVGCQHSHAGLARLSSAASVHLQLSVEGKQSCIC